MKKQNTLLFILIIYTPLQLYGTVVTYSINIKKQKISIEGRQSSALTLNDTIPGPTIEATVGDTLEVTFNNQMDEETSIHWHGVLVPPDQDGVPYLNTPPIAPHSSFTYRFLVKHAGTYWYHSHTGLQEQRGLFGALVFHPKNGERVPSDDDQVIVFSDWINENPNQVLAHLKKDGDYYALKKKNVQSWVRVLQHGPHAIKNRIKNALSRMGPMDLSDIGYDAFLANGLSESYMPVKSEKTVRLRLINAAASSYFNVEYAGHPMTIISADGIDVEPVKVKRLQIAIAETYDVIVHVPDTYSYELRATSEDGTGYSSVFIGTGEKVYAPIIPKPNLFLMTHQKHNQNQNKETPPHAHESNHTNEHSNTQPAHQRNSIIEHMTEYSALRSHEKTAFAPNKSIREVPLRLTGNMEQYVWSFNNKTLLESKKILIYKDEIVRFVFHNETMMHHPLHLHGHFFRVLNGQGEKSPLKHTVNVPAMQTITIEFEANESHDWFFHCHNLYHMKAGMARVISYADTTHITKKMFSKFAHDNWYMRNDIAALSNMMTGMAWAANTRNKFEIEYDYNYGKEYDIELTGARNLTRFFSVYAGACFEQEEKKKQKNKNDNPCTKINTGKKEFLSEKTAIFGIHYTLPLFIEADVRMNSKGKWRLELSSSMQITDRTLFEWFCNTDREYRTSLSYEVNKELLLMTTYDSDFEWGAGIRLRL